MKTKLFCLRGCILLAVLLILGSCTGMAEPVRSEFKLERSSQTLYGSTVQIRFNSNKKAEGSTLAQAVSDRYERDMMRWADYSALDTTP